MPHAAQRHSRICLGFAVSSHRKTQTYERTLIPDTRRNGHAGQPGLRPPTAGESNRTAPGRHARLAKLFPDVPIAPETTHDHENRDSLSLGDGPDARAGRDPPQWERGTVLVLRYAR